MNGAHIHLVLNHFPIVGLFFSLLILSIGLLRTSLGFIRAGLLIMVVSSALAVPTYFTGESAEDVIKKSPTFAHELVEEHEAAAFYAIWTMGLTGLACSAALYLSLKKNRIPKPLMILIVVLQIFTFTVIARTNYLGGTISHPEMKL